MNINITCDKRSLFIIVDTNIQIDLSICNNKFKLD